MKQPVRAFSIGLFASGIILLAIVLFFDESKEKTKDESHQEKIASLEKDGFRVLTEEKYISLSVNNDKPENEKKDEAKKEKEETKNEEKPSEEKENPAKEIKTYTLKIEPGLASSSTISSVLEKNQIIDSASKFSKYLEDHDYSKYVQIGTFKLTSDMTFKEVAETITK